MIDWISGERFIELAEMVYSPEGTKGDCNPLKNTFCPCCLKEVNIVYTHTMYVKELFSKIKGLKCEFIVITHNCDTNIGNGYVLPDNVRRWFSQNVNTVHPRIEAIPIGLENNRWYKNIGKKQKMEDKLKKPKVYKNLVYLNANVQTNPGERQPLYDLFKHENWVTVKHGMNGIEFDEYLESIYSHRFVFCPRGNGIDTVRLWESLYMNSIPIVKNDLDNIFFHDLPIYFVDDWREITKTGLLEYAESISNMTFNKELLNFEYWKNKILSYAK